MLHIQAWASALPSDFDRAMREASDSRMATDTDSCAFFVYILAQYGELVELLIFCMNCQVIRQILTAMLALMAFLGAKGVVFTIGDLNYRVISETDAEVVGPVDSGLENAVIPETVNFDSKDYAVTAIAANAFQFCKNLRSVKMPDSIETISDDAFWHCGSLVDVNFPNSLDSIGRSAFSGCKLSEEIVIPESVSYIGYYAFGGCSSVETVTVYGSAVICDGAFSIASLKRLEILGDYSTIGRDVCGNGESFVSLVLPNKYVSLEEAAFMYCRNLREISICEAQNESNQSEHGDRGEEFKSIIGEKAFYGCELLETVKLPQGVTDLDKGAFENCKSLKNIEFPETLRFLGGWCFNGCNGLAKIYIPDSVEEMGDYIFTSCKALSDIRISHSLKKLPVYCFAYCNSLKEIQLPENLQLLDEQCFYNCRALEKIVIPENVVSIGGGAFQKCVSLKEVYFLNDATFIEDHAFENCSSLPGIKLPSLIDRITEASFAGCSSLKSIEIPESVRCIELAAFANCDALVEIVIPEGVDSLGNSVFNRCVSLRKVQFKNDATTIGKMAFYKCTGLREVELPMLLDRIAGSMFYGCESLETISIPETVNEIGDYAFAYCHGLDTIYCYAPIPPVCIEANRYALVFDKVSKDAVVYIPSGTKKLYEEAGGWNYFWDFREMASGIVDVNDEDVKSDVEYFDMNGIRVEKPTTGVYIKKEGTRIEKVLVD